MRLIADGLKRAGELAAWRQRLGQGWDQVKVEAVESDGIPIRLRVGSELRVRARVNLGVTGPGRRASPARCMAYSIRWARSPDRMRRRWSRTASRTVRSGIMPVQSTAPPAANTVLRCACCRGHEDLGNPFEPGLVTWGQ